MSAEDGALLASASSDGNIRVWDLTVMSRSSDVLSPQNGTLLCLNMTCVQHLVSNWHRIGEAINDDSSVANVTEVGQLQLG
eukprot:1200187-Amphidinium_carterae.1